jgi:hypothetical protein
MISKRISYVLFLSIISNTVLILTQNCPLMGCPNVKLEESNGSCNPDQLALTRRVYNLAAEAMLREASERFYASSSQTNIFKSVFGLNALARDNPQTTNILTCLRTMKRWASGEKRRQHFARCSNTDVSYAGYRPEAGEPVLIVNWSFLNDAKKLGPEGSNVFASPSRFTKAEPIRAMVHELAHSICGLNNKDLDSVRFTDITSWRRYVASTQGKASISEIADAYAVYVVSVAERNLLKSPSSSAVLE